MGSGRHASGVIVTSCRCQVHRGTSQTCFVDYKQQSRAKMRRLSRWVPVHSRVTGTPTLVPVTPVEHWNSHPSVVQYICIYICLYYIHIYVRDGTYPNAASQNRAVPFASRTSSLSPPGTQKSPCWPIQHPGR